MKKQIAILAIAMLASCKNTDRPVLSSVEGRPIKELKNWDSTWEKGGFTFKRVNFGDSFRICKWEDVFVKTDSAVVVLSRDLNATDSIGKKWRISEVQESKRTGAKLLIRPVPEVDMQVDSVRKMHRDGDTIVCYVSFTGKERELPNYFIQVYQERFEVVTDSMVIGAMGYCRSDGCKLEYHRFLYGYDFLPRIKTLMNAGSSKQIKALKIHNPWEL